MSDRLHIGATNSDLYDCVLTNVDGAEAMLRQYFAWGPWKIVIGDVELFRKITPLLEQQLTLLSKHFPDDVWMFFYGDEKIEHPSLDQLDSWLTSSEIAQCLEITNGKHRHHF